MVRHAFFDMSIASRAEAGAVSFNPLFIALFLRHQSGWSMVSGLSIPAGWDAFFSEEIMCFSAFSSPANSFHFVFSQERWTIAGMRFSIGLMTRTMALILAAGNRQKIPATSGLYVATAGFDQAT